MANLSDVSDSSKLHTQVENYFEQQTLILECLKKAQAPIYVALGEDFLNYHADIVHHYLWASSDRFRHYYKPV